MSRFMGGADLVRWGWAALLMRAAWGRPREDSSGARVARMRSTRFHRKEDCARRPALTTPFLGRVTRPWPVWCGLSCLCLRCCCPVPWLPEGVPLVWVRGTARDGANPRRRVRDARRPNVLDADRGGGVVQPPHDTCDTGAVLPGPDWSCRQCFGQCPGVRGAVHRRTPLVQRCVHRPGPRTRLPDRRRDRVLGGGFRRVPAPHGGRVGVACRAGTAGPRYGEVEDVAWNGGGRARRPRTR